MNKDLRDFQIIGKQNLVSQGIKGAAEAIRGEGGE